MASLLFLGGGRTSGPITSQMRHVTDGLVRPSVQRASDSVQRGGRHPACQSVPRSIRPGRKKEKTP